MNENQTQFATSQYINTTNTSAGIQFITTGNWTEGNGLIDISMKAKTGIHPELYFKYIKKKFGTIERIKIDARLKRLEKAFEEAVKNGQIFLGNKLMLEVVRETRESILYAKGIKHYIEFEDITKHKRNIRGGHISDTKFEEFTRVIPKEVLAKKKAVEILFDGFVIYHYWDEEAEKKRAKNQKMTPDEKQKMRDPVLFGVIRESSRLYYVADWEDELCDLSFEEIIDAIGATDESSTINRQPKLSHE